MKPTNALELETYLDNARHILFVYRNLNWSLFPIVSCIVCGDVIMWISVIYLLEGPLVKS
jgi:hypothetical protein